MGFFNSFEESKNNRDQFEGQKNEASVSHELMGSAAAFGAFELWEREQRKEGKPVEHSKAKALLAAAAGFEVDRLAETKGEDWVDRRKAKTQAENEAKEMYESHYENNHDEWHPDHAPPAEFNV